MMEEVSMDVALDAHAFEQMSEEEIFACLEADTGPKFKVPKEKAKLKERLLQIMEDEDDGGDFLDKHLRENRQLQAISMQLEQENDSLAHRLISGKVELRRALDKVEEKVDELAKDLLQARKELQVKENEKILNEEETAMLKEVFRRELEKAEQRVSRSSGIVEDYKQICSQLTSRLERQQAAHREEFDSLKSAIKSCSRCRHVVDSEAPLTAGQASETPGPAEEGGMPEQRAEENDAAPAQGEVRRRVQEKESFNAQIKEVEKELAQTKLLMVEAKCKIQELEHQKGILANDLQEAKNSWISKAFTSLRISSGGLHSLAVPRDRASTAGWRMHSTSVSGWSSGKLPWNHGDNRKMSDTPKS